MKIVKGETGRLGLILS